MQTTIYEGTLTALSSISHTGDTYGVTHAFRRESVLAENGSRLMGVPVLAGSVIRGGLRRRAAAMMQHALVGDGRLPFTAVHALRTGGALTETRKATEVLTGEKQARLRDLIPMLGLFGVSGGGRIMSGRLLVDKAIPLTVETRHLFPTVAAPEQLPSIFEVVQTEDYSQHPDVTDAQAGPLVEGGGELGKGAGQMRWSIETLLPGTVLGHALIGEDLTPVEASFFDELVTEWSKNCRVGGQRARGMGRVRVDYARTTTDLDGTPVTKDTTTNWRTYVNEHRDEAMEALTWL